MGYETFKKLCDDSGVTPTYVARETKVDPSAITNWKQGVYTPKDDKRRKLADFFGVSLEYLDTGDESLRNIEKEVEADTDPNIKELYSIAKKATPEERAAIVRMMKAFFDEQ